MAATYISRMPPEQQHEIVQEHGTQPSWRLVIMCLLWSLNRPSELERLLAHLGPVRGIKDEEALAEIRGAVAFGDFSCSPGFVDRVVEETIAAIELGDRQLHRGRLVETVLGGLQNARLRALALETAQRWVFAREEFRASAIAGLGFWPQSDQTKHLLRMALNDEDDSVQRTAAEAISRVYGGDAPVSELLVDLATRSQRTSTRAAAIEALSLGWATLSTLENMLETARNSRSDDIALAAIGSRVHLGLREQSDVDRLIGIASDRSSEAGAWADTIAAALVDGWAGEAWLRDLCLEAAEHRRAFDGFDAWVAERILLAGFPQDTLVADWIVRRLASERFPFSRVRFDAWQFIANNFRDHPTVVAAIDEWALKQETASEPDLSLAALVGRTETMRGILLGAISGSSFAHWPAGSLVDGWGMDDPEIAEVLTSYVLGQTPANASGLAHLAPRIITEPQRCRQLLLQMLNDPGCRRPDLVLSGLASLQDPGDLNEIVQPALRHVDRPNVGSKDALMVYFPLHPDVRSLAVGSLGRRDCPYGLIAKVYSADIEIRDLLAKLLAPLPVALRARIVNSLGRAPQGDQEATRILGDFDPESSSEVRLLAALAWGRRVDKDAAEREQAIDVFLELLGAAGLHYEGRMHAGFGGLVVLGEAHRFVDFKGRFGNQEPVELRLDFLSDDRSFFRLVAENWDYLQGLLGDQLPQRLSASVSGEFWKKLCAVAHDYPLVHMDLLRILDGDQEVARTAEGISFLSKVRPTSDMLLCLCLEAAAMSTSGNIHDYERNLVVGQVLTSQFGDRSDVYAALTQGELNFHDEARLIALCRGWPGSSALQELRKHVDEPGPAGSKFEFMVAETKVAELPKRLADCIGRYLASRNKHFAMCLREALVARLVRDEEAVNCLAETLRDSDFGLWFKTCIPGVMAIAGRLDPEVREWATEEISRQSQESRRALGFDLVAGEIRGVMDALLDALE